MDRITRRRLLKSAAYFTAASAIRTTAFLDAQTTVPLVLDPDNLQRYVDSLPLPQIARPTGTRASPVNRALHLPYYRIPMREIECKIHRDLPPTRMWGFGSSSPGPTFETRSGEGLIVEWVNALPSKHFLPIDHTLHGAEPDKPEVRSVIHLHGGKTPPESDGYPEDWCVPGKSIVCHYPNRQDAGMLFYHDHAMGINRLNIYAGLQGLFFVRDDVEDALNLPRGKYEVPLLIYDRFLRPDGQLDYPISGKPESPWVPEVFGNAILVNGKLFPYLEVEPRRYRFRLMNGSNGRFYRFSIGKGSTFHQIATEQGLLPAPVPLQRIVMAPAERIDFVFDFSAHAGENLLLRSDAFDIMQFRVVRSGTGETSTLPETLRPVSRISESQAITTRRLTLDEKMDLIQNSMGMLLNNTAWHMPITEKPVIDTTEIWEFVNLTDDAHPIHLHLVRFQILDRRPFDKFDFQDKGIVRFTGPAIPVALSESGWKDTVRADPGMVTRIIVPFEGFTGRYVWHCHVLEHEDNEMMRPYEIVPASRAT